MTLQTAALDALAQLETLGTGLGALTISVAIDGAPIFLAPSRNVAQRLRHAGYTFATWRTRRDEVLGTTGANVRGWH